MIGNVIDASVVSDAIVVEGAVVVLATVGLVLLVVLAAVVATVVLIGSVGVVFVSASSVHEARSSARQTTRQRRSHSWSHARSIDPLPLVRCLAD